MESTAEDVRKFLETFTDHYNAARLTERQAKTILIDFCDGALRDTVRADLKRGLKYALAELKETFCPRETKTERRRKLKDIKMNEKEPLKTVRLVKLHFQKIYPTRDEEQIEDMVKNHIIQLSSPKFCEKAWKKEEEYKRRHLNATYDFATWKKDLNEIGRELQTDQATHHVNVVTMIEEGEETLGPLETENKERDGAAEIAKIVSDTASRFYAEGQRSVKLVGTQASAPAPAQTGPREGDPTKVKPMPPRGSDYEKAARQHDLKALISAETDYPYNNQTKLAYDFRAGVFDPHEEIPRAPGNPFLVYQDGKSVIGYSTINHFKGRCTQCGMQGHSATHPRCVYAKCSPTYYLCRRCGTAFHAAQKCAINLNKVVSKRRTEN